MVGKTRLGLAEAADLVRGVAGLGINGGSEGGGEAAERGDGAVEGWRGPGDAGGELEAERLDGGVGGAPAGGAEGAIGLEEGGTEAGGPEAVAGAHGGVDVLVVNAVDRGGVESLRGEEVEEAAARVGEAGRGVDEGVVEVDEDELRLRVAGQRRLRAGAGAGSGLKVREWRPGRPGCGVARVSADA